MKALHIGIALLGLTALTQAKDLRSDINKMSNTITHAMEKKDMKTLEKTMKAGLTPDFAYVEAGQKQSFSEMFENMKAGIGQMKKLKAATKITSLKQTGNTATCLMSHSMTGFTSGPDKKDHTMAFSGISEDKYVKVGGKWLMSQMSWKSQKGTMDGKPMAGMGH